VFISALAELKDSKVFSSVNYAHRTTQPTQGWRGCRWVHGLHRQLARQKTNLTPYYSCAACWLGEGEGEDS